MKKLLLLIAILFMLTATTKSQSNSKNNFAFPDKQKHKEVESKEQLMQTWTLFAKAILANDTETFKRLSTDCIRCVECVVSTEEDSALKSNYPDTWYKKLYKELCYISIDTFLNKGYSMVFDTVTKARLLNNNKLVFHEDEINGGLYDKLCISNSSLVKNARHMEVLVTVSDSSKEWEGSQKAFAFIQSRYGYKFCGYSTIP